MPPWLTLSSLEIWSRMKFPSLEIITTPQTNLTAQFRQKDNRWDNSSQGKTNANKMDIGWTIPSPMESPYLFEGYPVVRGPERGGLENANYDILVSSFFHILRFVFFSLSSILHACISLTARDIRSLLFALCFLVRYFSYSSISLAFSSRWVTSWGGLQLKCLWLGWGENTSTCPSVKAQK